MLAPFSFGQEVGDSWGDGFGECITRVDDLDCDGLADFAVGAPCSKVPADSSGWTPRVFLYSAWTGTLIGELATVSKEQIGYNVWSAPDIDGDGIAEIVSGRVVFSGFDGRELLAPRRDLKEDGHFYWSTPPLVLASTPGEVGPAQLDRLFYSPCAERDRRVLEAAFELVRPRIDVMGVQSWPRSRYVPTRTQAHTGDLSLGVETVPSEHSWSSYSLVLRSTGAESALLLPDCSLAVWIGDVDRDGITDFAAVRSDTVQLHSGRTGEVLRQLDGSGQGFGFSLAGGRDLDADGISDVLVGTSCVDLEIAEAFSGATGSRLARIEGRFIDHLGTSVSFLDDVDGDRVPEIAVGNLWIGMMTHWGEVIVYSGRTQQILYRVQSPYLPK